MVRKAKKKEIQLIESDVKSYGTWMAEQLFGYSYREKILIVLKMRKSFNVSKIWKLVENNYDVYSYF